jgi:hypothetical protein
MLFVALAISLGLLTPAILEAQFHSVVIEVTDSASVPVQFASVNHGGNTLITDRTGKVRIARAQAGRFIAQVRRIGFREAHLEFQLAHDTTVVVVMNPVATLLQAQQVVARRTSPLDRTGYYDRAIDRQKGLNNGYFITPEELERRKPTRLTQMLQGIPGVRVSQVDRVGAVPRGTDGCAMTIYVDGARVQTYATSMTRGTSRMGPMTSSRPGATDVSIDDIVGGSTVDAIEVYPRGAGAPARFQMLGGTCGIIAIWTKS